MEPWQTVFRVGLAPQLGRRHLEALREALASDSPELCQRGTTEPTPIAQHLTDPVEAACPLAYMGWKGEPLTTVVEVHRWFNAICQEAWRLLRGTDLDHTHFVNWVDDHPRDSVRLQLLAEVTAELQRRNHGEEEADAVRH